MKKTLLLGCIVAFLCIGQETLASNSSFNSENQENKQDNKPVSDGENTGGESEVIRVDSMQIVTDGESSDFQGPVNPLPEDPAQSFEEEQNPPAEDQSAVSSFNFFYFLIEKIKFPDLLDESF